MNAHFSTFDKPNYEKAFSADALEQTSPNIFETYSIKNSFFSNPNQIIFNGFEDNNEVFFRQRQLYKLKYQNDSPNYIDEYMLPNLKETKIQFDFEKRLLFDISLFSKVNENFNKYIDSRFNLNELISFEEQMNSIGSSLKPIEQYLTEDESNTPNLQFNIPFLNLDTNGNKSCKYLLEFDLKKDDHTVFSTFPNSTKTKFDENMISRAPFELDFLTSSMFIHNEFNNMSNNNSFIEPIIQSESYFDRFVHSMNVIILKFDCKPTMCFEPFTQEWLADLQISKRDFDEKIEVKKKIFYEQKSSLSEYDVFKTQNKIKLTVEGNISEEYSPLVSKVPRNIQNIIINNQNDDEIVRIVQKEHFEKEIPTGKIPDIVQLNTLLFSDDDITFYGKLFQNLKFIGIELNEILLMTINDNVANIFLIEDDYDSLIPIITDLCITFNEIVITTTIKPHIFLSEKIKWRYITSHTQIATAILPYLIEENLNAKDDLLTDI